MGPPPRNATKQEEVVRFSCGDSSSSSLSNELIHARPPELGCRYALAPFPSLHVRQWPLCKNRHNAEESTDDLGDLPGAPQLFMDASAFFLMAVHLIC